MSLPFTLTFERPGNGPESVEGIELPQPLLEPPSPSIIAPHKVMTRGCKRKPYLVSLHSQPPRIIEAIL